MKGKIEPVIIEDTFGLKGFGIKDTSKVAMMKVSGNKFIHQGIADGSYVYIEIGGEYRLNDIVLVKLEDGNYKLVKNIEYGMTYIGRVFISITSIEGDEKLD